MGGRKSKRSESSFRVETTARRESESRRLDSDRLTAQKPIVDIEVPIHDNWGAEMMQCSRFWSMAITVLVLLIAAIGSASVQPEAPSAEPAV